MNHSNLHGLYKLLYYVFESVYGTYTSAVDESLLRDRHGGTSDFIKPDT